MTKRSLRLGEERAIEDALSAVVTSPETLFRRQIGVLTHYFELDGYMALCAAVEAFARRTGLQVPSSERDAEDLLERAVTEQLLALDSDREAARLIVMRLLTGKAGQGTGRYALPVSSTFSTLVRVLAALLASAAGPMTGARMREAWRQLAPDVRIDDEGIVDFLTGAGF